jgi:putative transposase
LVRARPGSSTGTGVTSIEYLDTSFCLDALEDALGKGRPEVFNTYQGRNSPARHSPICWKCGISMDGRGRWLDNVFVARL